MLQQRREETLKRFSPPTVSLKANGGHKLDILSQTQLTLSHGKCTVETMVLVQQGTPNHLLLGTDVQPKLGFALVAETTEKLVNLLTGEECTGESLNMDIPRSSKAQLLSLKTCNNGSATNSEAYLASE